MYQKMIWYCEKCEKIIPELETKVSFIGMRVHSYTKEVNYYKNLLPGKIGYCPKAELITSGRVREPTDQEYFIANLTQRI